MGEFIIGALFCYAIFLVATYKYKTKHTGDELVDFT